MANFIGLEQVETYLSNLLEVVDFVSEDKVEKEKIKQQIIQRIKDAK